MNESIEPNDVAPTLTIFDRFKSEQPIRVTQSPHTGWRGYVLGFYDAEHVIVTLYSSEGEPSQATIYFEYIEALDAPPAPGYCHPSGQHYTEQDWLHDQLNGFTTPRRRNARTELS